MSEVMINRAKAIIDLATKEEKAELLEYISPKGEWLEHVYARKCSVCGSVTCWTDDDGIPIPGNFCPNCGAKMKNPIEECYLTKKGD